MTGKHSTAEYCQAWAEYVVAMLGWNKTYRWGYDGCIVGKRNGSQEVFTIEGFSPETILRHLVMHLEKQRGVKRPEHD